MSQLGRLQVALWKQASKRLEEPCLLGPSCIGGVPALIDVMGGKEASAVLSMAAMHRHGGLMKFAAGLVGA